MKLSPEVRVFATKLLIATSLVVALLFAWQIVNVLLIFFASVLVALLLRFIASFVNEHSKLNYGLSLGLTILSILAVLAVSGYFIASPLVEQIQGIASEVPASIESLRNSLNEWLPEGWVENLSGSAPSVEEATSAGGGIANTLFGAFSSLFQVVTAFAIFIVSTVYLAANPGYYRRGFLRLLPLKSQEKASSIIERSNSGLVRWLGGQLIVMLLVGAITAAGLTALGVPFALGLGFLAGLLEFVPTIGPLIAAIPAILLALTQSPMLAFYTGIFYLVIQQVEGNILVPLVYKRAVSLPPVLTLFTVLALGSLFGVLGLLLAPPLLVVAQILIQELYLKERDDISDKS